MTWATTRMTKWPARWLALLCCLFGMGGAQAAPALAFFYGANPPWDELQAFDLVVVDPGHVPDPAAPKLPKTKLAAYVSVGEVHPDRPYAKEIPAAWLLGENRDWGSRVVNQAAPEWPKFYSDKVIDPLWNAGYRAFFLDTLDSYQLFAKTPEQRAAQEAGMIALINEIKRRHPDAQLIYNRGFEILDRTYRQVYMLAAESLFQGYDAGRNAYRPVPQADRDWLLAQLKKAREEYKLEVISIDYVAPDQRALARQTAEQIRALGFIPWVATPGLDGLGVGAIEVMPRKVLMVTSTFPNEFGLRNSEAVRLGSMPLNYLGYVPEYVDLAHLPDKIPQGLYAGVVVWLTARGSNAEVNRLGEWLGKRKAEGLPFALVNYIEALTQTPLGRTLGVTTASAPDGLGAGTVVQQAAMMGFERQPRPDADDFQPLAIREGEPLLTISRGKQRQVGAAITPWGGFVRLPYAAVTLASDQDARWVIDPFAFFRAALRLPDMPVPDPTTMSGRRMFLVHMDGDGFVSRSELPGNPYAGAVVRDRVVRKYNLPMTISVIEAEVAPHGLYPKDSPRLEAIARDIFAAPNVQIASHSYSHPFNWQKAENVEAGDGEGFSLNVPGYHFDVQREVEGSIRYIESRLAPANKKVALFLWTGDCAPGRDALEWTERLGVLNMNGGDTDITRSRNTLTQVEGLGLDKSGLFQVFAPNQNENVYTNLWTGPFYGFERVIETFELTESPRRLKPINIYFHTYLTTKTAGMQSLDKVFAWALRQETTPVYAAEYARIVLEFRRTAIARTPEGWRIRGADLGRTLRAPLSLGTPDLRAGSAVAGYKREAQAQYIHLGDGAAELTFTQTAMPSPAQPRLVSANGRVESSAREAGKLTWNLGAHVPLQFALADADACTVRAGGRTLTPMRREGGVSHYQITEHAARPLEAICRY